jgi:hypothetical protein
VSRNQKGSARRWQWLKRGDESMSDHSHKTPALHVEIIASSFQMQAMKGISISEKNIALSLESSLLLNLVSENGELL